MAKFHIFFASDHNYALPLGVLISSILKTGKDNDHFNFYVIDGGITPSQKEMIQSIESSFPWTLQFLIPEDNWLTKKLVSLHREGWNHVSSVALFKMMIPFICPELDKVLYMDSDMLVTSSLSPLWETSLDGVLAAAVPEIKWARHPFNRKLGLNSDSLYVNSGLLLINAKAWRSQITETVILDVLKNVGRINRFQDQDYLNALMANKIKYIGYEYNIFSSLNLSCGKEKPYPRPISDLWGNFDFNEIIFPSVEQLKLAFENPIVIHYITHNKPWDLKSSSSLDQYWFNVIKGSPLEYYWKKMIEEKQNSKITVSEIYNKLTLRIRKKIHKLRMH